MHVMRWSNIDIMFSYITMDVQYNEYVTQTEVIFAWKNGFFKGIMIGVLIGGASIGLVGLFQSC